MLYINTHTKATTALSMNDEDASLFFERVKRNAHVIASNTYVHNKLSTLYTIDPDAPLHDAITHVTHPYARSLLQKQYGFLCELIEDSQLYLPTKLYLQRAAKLCNSSADAANEFRQLTRMVSQRSNAPNAIKRLQHYDCTFVMSATQKLHVPPLDDLTLNQFRALIPAFIADTSINYQHKRVLVNLFPNHVTVPVLTHWGVPLPVYGRQRLPTEFYEKRFLKDWVEKEPAAGQYFNSLALAGFLRPDSSTLLDSEDWSLQHQIEYTGMHASKYALQRDHTLPVSAADLMKYAEYLKKQHLDKLSLPEVSDLLLSMQVSKCNTAANAVQSTSELLANVSSVDKAARSHRQATYRKLHTAVLNLKQGGGDHNTLLANTMTYSDWCTHFKFPLSLLEQWKSDQDSKEEQRRTTFSFKPNILVATESKATVEQELKGAKAAGLSTLGSSEHQFELLTTLENVWKRELVAWDKRFKEQTGGLDYNATSTNTPALQAISNRRKNALAKIAIVQDRLDELNNGYVMGALGTCNVSGITFVNKVLRTVVPHAYNGLSQQWSVDDRLNTLELQLNSANTAHKRSKETLHTLKDALETFITLFYNSDYNAELKQRWEQWKLAKTPGESLVVSRHCIEASSLQSVQDALALSGPAHQIATILDRVNMEGGSPSDYAGFEQATQDLSSLQINVDHDQLISEHVQELIVSAKDQSNQTIAMNRFQSTKATLIQTHLAKTDQTSALCEELQTVLKQNSEALAEQHKTTVANALFEDEVPIYVQVGSNTSAPEPIRLMDSFEEQFAKAAAMVNFTISKQSEVNRLEEELEEERNRIAAIEQKAEAERTAFATLVAQKELVRIEQERISKELIQKTEQQKLEADALAEQESERAESALEEVELQKIEFNKERIQLQNRSFYSDDSSDTSDDLELLDPVWSDVAATDDVAATEKLEDEASTTKSLLRGYAIDEHVHYISKDGELHDAIITAIHADSEEGYFTIQCGDKEIQTTEQRLCALTHIDESDAESVFSELDLDPSFVLE